MAVIKGPSLTGPQLHLIAAPDQCNGGVAPVHIPMLIRKRTPWQMEHAKALERSN